MSHFYYPHRFNSYEEGVKFLRSEPDAKPSIPPFIKRGGKAIPNPKYVNARYEISVRVIK